MKIELRTKIDSVIYLFTHQAVWPAECHDAVAAHAFKNAIAETDKVDFGGNEDHMREWIETRAAELLASYLDEGKL